MASVTADVYRPGPTRLFCPDWEVGPLVAVVKRRRGAGRIEEQYGPVIELEEHGKHAKQRPCRIPATRWRYAYGDRCSCLDRAART